MAKSEIQWTDYTWNPVTGCSKVSQGCKFCYAESIAKRFWGNRDFTDIISHEERINIPINLKKPRMIFVNSMSDLFHAKVSDDFIRQVFNVMNISHKHIFQVLTKRPTRMRSFLKDYYGEADAINTIHANYQHTSRVPISNIWLGVSVENQQTVADRIGILQDVKAKVRWLSCEPLLDDIDLSGWLNGIDWVVVGCESGPHKRECKIEWVEDIVDQCKRAKVPIFVKQLQNGGEVLKDIEQFPEHLRIREYPI